MEEFIDYVLQFGNLNKQQIDLIKSKATETELRKDEFYWEAGKTVKQIGFITSGILRVFYYNNKGEEVTQYFFDENHLLLSGFTVDEVYTPSVYISAITDCKMIVFSKQAWKEISQTIIDWDNIIQKIITKHKSEKLGKISELVSQDGTTRYLDFIGKFPTLANRIPLSYIASFLGLTQSSLSRIRKNIR
ncbi:crp/fnr family transcriptional regulator [Chryseobacterium sp. StRB126]|uniref:Crp/Fnr family transcriptional regulator n=1 Tax=Chryseobacterium sp. StRB126 TaxID=878220 RepID=UPI0004E987D1|nr:Crp/Fnr family transcriptional regulator [Chryseobacterium sp. StRB126]BAP31940.1 crp/fnr family transcriptional regulator [Chryseobacterium sp. StRB126]